MILNSERLFNKFTRYLWPTKDRQYMAFLPLLLSVFSSFAFPPKWLLDVSLVSSVPSLSSQHFLMTKYLTLRHWKILMEYKMLIFPDQRPQDKGSNDFCYLSQPLYPSSEDGKTHLLRAPQLSPWQAQCVHPKNPSHIFLWRTLCHKHISIGSWPEGKCWHFGF